MSYRSTTDIAETEFQGVRTSKMKNLIAFLKDNALVRYLTRYSEDQYRPEKHYMRGPGPKAKAKADPAPACEKKFSENQAHMQHR